MADQGGVTCLLHTPAGTPATNADRVLAVASGALCGAMIAGMFVRGFAFGFLWNHMSPVQVWTLKGAMATTASLAAIRALRRTEEIGASKAVVEVVAQLFVLFGLGVAGMLIAHSLVP